MDTRRSVILIAAFIALIVNIRCENIGLLNLTVTINGTEGGSELKVTHTNSGEGINLDRDLHCSQSKKYDVKKGDVIINVDKTRERLVGESLDSFTFLYVYKLHVQKEGYLWCASNKQNITSEIEFFLSNNQLVSVAKLNRTLALHELQGEGKLFKVLQLSKDKKVFHLISENTTSHESILHQLQNILQNKSVTVEYIRSAGVCPPSDKLKLPATELPFNASLAMDIEKCCEGNFYTGAYWNDKLLEKLGTQKIQEILRSQQVKKIDYSALDTKDIIQEFSKTLEGLSYLKQEDVKTIASNFNLLLLADKNVLQEDGQNSSNRLLERLDILLLNTSLVSKEKKVQVEQENFAARVEDFKETGTTGVFVWDHATAEEGTRLQMESLNKTHKVENILYSLPRFVRN
jgi:hypothetical protein